MSNVNAKRNVNAESKQSYCELNEEDLDVVSGGFFSIAGVASQTRQIPKQSTPPDHPENY